MSALTTVLHTGVVALMALTTMLLFAVRGHEKALVGDNINLGRLLLACGWALLTARFMDQMFTRGALTASSPALIAIALMALGQSVVVITKLQHEDAEHPKRRRGDKAP
jgi:hypothetical protein